MSSQVALSINQWPEPRMQCPCQAVVYVVNVVTDATSDCGDSSLLPARSRDSEDVPLALFTPCPRDPGEGGLEGGHLAFGDRSFCLQHPHAFSSTHTHRYTMADYDAAMDGGAASGNGYGRDRSPVDSRRERDEEYDRNGGDADVPPPRGGGDDDYRGSSRRDDRERSPRRRPPPPPPGRGVSVLLPLSLWSRKFRASTTVGAGWTLFPPQGRQPLTWNSVEVEEDGRAEPSHTDHVFCDPPLRDRSSRSFYIHSVWLTISRKRHPQTCSDASACPSEPRTSILRRSSRDTAESKRRPSSMTRG